MVAPFECEEAVVPSCPLEFDVNVRVDNVPLIISLSILINIWSVLDTCKLLGTKAVPGLDASVMVVVVELIAPFKVVATPDVAPVIVTLLLVEYPSILKNTTNFKKVTLSFRPEEESKE